MTHCNRSSFVRISGGEDFVTRLLDIVNIQIGTVNYSYNMDFPMTNYTYRPKAFYTRIPSHLLRNHGVIFIITICLFINQQNPKEVAITLITHGKLSYIIQLKF